MKQDKRRSALFLFEVVLGLLVVWCVGCAGRSPVAPALDEKTTVSTADGNYARTSWGFWDIYIERETGRIDVVPIRSATFECNVVIFLQPPKAPIQLLNVALNAAGTDLLNGKVSADVSLKHPFPGSYRCGFDVMGIVMDDYPFVTLGSDPAIMYSLHPSVLLRNPDGWTRWWNQPEFTTIDTILGYTEGARAKGSFWCNQTLNPFKYFSDDLGPMDAFDPDPAARGFFSSESPGTNVRRYELQFPMGPGEPIIHIKYAVSASYVDPYVSATPPYTPDEWPIEANMPEAYKIDIIDNGSTAYFTPTTSGGDLNLLVEVRDWQLDGTLGAVANEIKSVTIESPTLFKWPLPVGLNGAELVAGNPTAVRFPISIPNVTPQAVEDQMLIVTVESAYPTTYKPQIPGITGFKYAKGALAAYNILEAPISPDVGPPTWVNENVAYGTFTGNHALDIDSLGYPHVAFRSFPDGNLRYAWFDGSQWNFVDSDYQLFLMEGMRLDSTDLPHAVIAPAYQEGVNWAHYNGSNWESFMVYMPWPGTPSSIAIDSLDRPHLAVHGGGGGGWGGWHRWRDGTIWKGEHFLENEQTIEPSIAISSKDVPHVATNYMYGSSDLYHCWWDSTQTSTWSTEPVGTSANASCLRIDSEDHLHVAFAMGAGGDPINQLGYALNEGKGWVVQVLDSSSDLRAASLAIDSQDHPHISYYDKTAGSLKYAHWDGAAWHIETVVPADVGYTSSIAIRPGDRPCIAYLDGSNTKIMLVWKK